MKNLMLLCLIVILYSCNNKDELRKLHQDPNWVKDYNGCLGLRSVKNAERLILNYKLTGASKEDFVKVFGKPNKIEKSFFSQSLFYVEESLCENEKLDPNAEKCFIIFSFTNDKLKDYHELCE
jgi:hypothetical protein